jgi:hypothetical protein
MSFTRRMIAAGLPAAGVTVLAALAFSGAPAMASPADAAGIRPVAMATPCSGGYRAGCAQGYGNETPNGTLPTTTAPAPAGTSTATPTGTSPATTHTRGHGGYGTAPATTPTTAHAATVPPGGVSPTTATPAPAVSKPGGGVSAGSALPVTGPPMGTIVSLGGLMIAAGAASVWYTRRRRSA